MYIRPSSDGLLPHSILTCLSLVSFLSTLQRSLCWNLGFQMQALSASAIRRPLTWLLSERYIRARSLLLYPYVFVVGPNKHDPFIKLVTKQKFQHIMVRRRQSRT